MSASDLPRRGFLTRLTTGTLALAGIAALRPSSASAVPRDRLLGGTASDYDDSWTKRVAGAAHKAVFDSPGIDDGAALVHPWTYRAGYRAALDADPASVVPVVVLRHVGLALALDDAIWEKYRIGEVRKIDDPATGKPATRNPWSRRRAGQDPDPMIAALLGPDADATVEGAIRSGVVVLACELAMRTFARGAAQRSGGDAAAITEELRRGVVPGVLVQPSGIYAATRAQEAGCTFMKSS